MLNLKRLSELEEMRDHWRENGDGAFMVDCEYIDDLLSFLGDMTLRNEILRRENEDLRRERNLKRTNA